MLRMNGLKFAEILRHNPGLNTIPAVVLTTSDEDRDRVKAYNYNVVGYILKPVSFSNFKETMTTLNNY